MLCDEEVVKREESLTLKLLNKKIEILEKKLSELERRTESTFKNNNIALKKFLYENMVTKKDLFSIKIGPPVVNGNVIYTIENASVSQVKSLLAQGLTVEQVNYAIGNKYSMAYISQLALEQAKKRGIPKH